METMRGVRSLLPRSQQVLSDARVQGALRKQFENVMNKASQSLDGWRQRCGNDGRGPSPVLRSPSQLIAALGRAGREDRRDLKSAVEALTEHSDPLVREEALSLLLSKWK